jgi:hypothetical protein
MAERIGMGIALSLRSTIGAVVTTVMAVVVLSSFVSPWMDGGSSGGDAPFDGDD